MTFPTRASTDAQKAIIGQLLETDVELRSMARQWVKLGMEELLNQMRRGDPATRAAIAKSLAGPLTKAITEAGDDDGNSELRAEMHQMVAEMRGEIMDEEMADPPTPKLTPKA